jgi:hypothetical protein
MHARTVCVLGAAIVLTACDEVTRSVEPELDNPRRNGLMCVGVTADGLLVVQSPDEGGGCADGFDLRTWT